MNTYRIWLGVATVNQPIKNLAIKRNEHYSFASDKEVEKWIKNKAKKTVDYYTWFASAKYAILKEDGTYLVGRYVD